MLGFKKFGALERLDRNAIHFNLTLSHADLSTQRIRFPGNPALNYRYLASRCPHSNASQLWAKFTSCNQTSYTPRQYTNSRSVGQRPNNRSRYLPSSLSHPRLAYSLGAKPMSLRMYPTRYSCRLEPNLRFPCSRRRGSFPTWTGPLTSTGAFSPHPRSRLRYLCSVNTALLCKPLECSAASRPCSLSACKPDHIDLASQPRRAFPAFEIHLITNQRAFVRPISRSFLLSFRTCAYAEWRHKDDKYDTSFFDSIY